MVNGENCNDSGAASIFTAKEKKRREGSQRILPLINVRGEKSFQPLKKVVRKHVPPFNCPVIVMLLLFYQSHDEFPLTLHDLCKVYAWPVVAAEPDQ